ncbi:MAG: glycosyltransferase [Lachnospiraceae bacterium]|nr:glycosyltransferase [Lachnospiraceae bacterium]
MNKLLNPSNWKKTYHYLRKNGPRAALNAALERLSERDNNSYTYTPPSEEELNHQRAGQDISGIRFSILVPVYQTPEPYFQEMIESVRAQTYENWELILADASPTDVLRPLAEGAHDPRIHYLKLKENKGISANTNEALSHAAGDYIGLLDHDDVLTPDALYEMARAIEESKKQGSPARLLYSDEDKWDGEASFYDPNFKPAFDQDLLWSNNYICHFLVMETALMKALLFRPDFDGAQDYDLVLRACGKIMQNQETGNSSQVLNISRVLYHWRCHRESTAGNPQSKRYAYEAGLKAVQANLKERGIAANVSHSMHLGFYRVDYDDIFRDRPEVAMVVGPVYRKGRIVSGALDEAGKPLYEGLHRGFDGGHLHRAGLWQSCPMGDFANCEVRPELWDVFLKKYPEFDNSERAQIRHTDTANVPDCGKSVRTGAPDSRQEAGSGDIDRCRAWADFVHARGCLILYDPERR